MSGGGTHLEEPKTGKVMARIRSGIVSGRYGPGLRLPTFAEMENDFAVGRAVIQNAVEVLKRDGFIRSEGRKGLFVAANPPHLFQYGLVMPSSPGEPGWGQLMTALNNEAHRIENTDGRKRFRLYYGVRAHDANPRTLPQLQEDLEAQRLAGLVIHNDTSPFVAPVLKNSPPVPHVYLWADAQTGVAPPCLTVNGTTLLQRALRFLKEKGRRRVAMIHMGGTNINVDHAALFAEIGLEYRAPWVQWVGRSDPAAAQHLVSLLMDYPQESRPDGLLVGDDNLVPYVCRGLVATGIRVGDALQLVAHCNWPWPPESVLPMVRIGFDMREVMQRAITTLGMQQEGKTPEPYQLVEPQFEWETRTSGA